MPPPLVVMILLPLKENAASAPCPPAGAPAVGRAERLGGVLHERDAVTLADLAERLVVAALAVEVDGEHGADAGARRMRSAIRAVEQLRVDRPRRRVGVDEERRRARVRDRVRARGEREAGARDLVAGADPEHDEREVERRRAARERDGVLDAGDAREARPRRRRRAARAARSSSTRSPRRRARPRGP